MAEKKKMTGRRVRELNGVVEWEISQAKMTLYSALGAEDLVVQQAVKVALMKLEAAQVAVRDIEMICALAAQRGPYKE